MRRNHEPSRQQRQPLGQRSIAALTVLSAPKQPHQRQQHPWIATNTAAGPGELAAPHPSTLGAMVENGVFLPNAIGTRSDNGGGSGPLVNGSPIIMSAMGRTRASSSAAQASGAYANGDIHSAAAAGDMARVAEHLRCGGAGGGGRGRGEGEGSGGGEVDVRDGRQWSLLHHASFHGRLVVVGALLDAGANVEARTAIDLTPLCLACQNGHLTVAEELLRRGASVDGVDLECGGGGRGATDGDTGAEGAPPTSNGANGGVAYGGHVKNPGGADKANAPVPAPPTALFIAAREGHLSVVEALLKRGGSASAAFPGPHGKLAGEVFWKGVDEETREKIRSVLAEARERGIYKEQQHRQQQGNDLLSEGGGASVEGRGSSKDSSQRFLPPTTVTSQGIPSSCSSSSAMPPDGGPIAADCRAERRTPPAVLAGDGCCHLASPAGVAFDLTSVAATEAAKAFPAGGGGRGASSLSVALASSGSGLAATASGMDALEICRCKVRSDHTRRDGGSLVSRLKSSGDGLAVGSGELVDRSALCGHRAQGDATSSSTPPPVVRAAFPAVNQAPSLSAHGPAASFSSTGSLRNCDDDALSLEMSPAEAQRRNLGCGGSIIVGGTCCCANDECAGQNCNQQGAQQLQPPLGGRVASTDGGISNGVGGNGGGDDGGIDTVVGGGEGAWGGNGGRGIAAESRSEGLNRSGEEELEHEHDHEHEREREPPTARDSGGDTATVMVTGDEEQWMKRRAFPQGQPQQWLHRYPVPSRLATAPPPPPASATAKSFSVNGALMSQQADGNVPGTLEERGRGEGLDVEEKWSVALSSLMDLRALYRASDPLGGGDGGDAAQTAWGVQRRALEETISELNMRLAGKDHDIAELHMQLEERQRDLRFMHGQDLELLELPGLVELEAYLQAALGRVAAKREWAVYHLLQQQDPCGWKVSGAGGETGGGANDTQQVTWPSCLHCCDT